MASPTVELVGATELRLALGRLGDQANDPKVAEAGAELVADAARERVPVKSGALEGTIHVERVVAFGAAVPSAAVVAGSSAVPYAGVQEFGWPDRGIDARHYLADAAADQADRVGELYADHVGSLVADVGRTTP